MSNSSDESLKNPSFVRLPRPQRVLELSRPLVPTKSSLLALSKHNPELRENKKLPSPLAQQPSTTPLVETLHSSSLPTSASSADVLASSKTESKADSLHTSAVRIMGPMTTLGTFTQDEVNWAIRAQRGRHGLVMVKRVKEDVGHTETRILEDLSHQNIARLLHSFYDSGSYCLAMEYCRFTLAELLEVSLKFQEQQVQYVARSVSQGSNLRSKV
jgi:hypothetical protein